MGVKIYNVTGSYPNMAKSGGALYTFDPEPTTIRYSYRKSIEYDEIPLDFLPEAWDSYIQIRAITVIGTMTESGGSSIKDRMESMDKLSFYYTSTAFSNQPVHGSGQGERVYALGVDFPKTGGDEEKISLVAIESQEYTLEPGGRHLEYSVVFREVSAVYVI